MNLEQFDPLPLGKFSHHHEIGGRVVVKETGHRGKITNLDQFNRVHVELDSGHLIFGRPEEFIPEDFPTTPVRPNSPLATALRSLNIAKVAADPYIDPIPVGETFAKRAKVHVRIGAELYNRFTRKTVTVTGIQGDKILFDGGFVEAECLAENFLVKE